MEANSTQYRLGEIAKFSYGKMPKKDLLGKGCYPTYSGYKYQFIYPEFNCEEGVIIVVARGVGGTGDVKIVQKRCYLTNLSIKIDLDKRKVDNRFFYYRFLNVGLKHLDSGSAQSQITINDLSKEIIFLPLLIEQKAIAHILGSLDDKIELNRKMNETLEAMAQALFKSWFVDFDPVIDNALAAGNPIPEALKARAEARMSLGDQRKPLPEDIRQQFPSRFTFSEEMGWIPEGWDVGVLEDMVILQRGFDLPKTKRTDGEYPLIVASGQDGTHHEFKVRGPGITTGRSGKLGEVIFVYRDFWPLNTTLWVKEFKNSSPYHALYLLKSLGLEKYNSGSAVPTLNRNHVHNISLLVPPLLIVEEYSNIVKGFYKRMNFNLEQGERVAVLRDTLLPKLLSGQLRIPDAEKLLQEAV